MTQSLRKTFYLILGGLSFMLGVIGIALPLLPTTPFILLAAFCFARSSPRFHQWLVRQPFFGKIILDWQQKGAISLKAKSLASIPMIILMAYPLIWGPLSWALKLALIVIALSVLTFIWTRPDK